MDTRMTSIASDFRIHRFSSDDVPERDRFAFVRDVYGRVIVKHDIEPHPGSPFHWQSVLRRLPGLGLASTNCSGVHTERTRAQIDSDDLILNVTLTGKRIVRQFGRDVVVGAGELAVTRSLDVASCDCDPSSRLLNIRIPVSALAPMIVDLDAVLVRVIPSDTESLQLLLKYAEILQTTDALQRADTRHLIVAHVHDLVALTLGITSDAAEIAKGRGVPAARLSAIRADITENLGRSDLTIDVIAGRHHVTPRYVRMLFEKKGLTFSEFVLRERLARAHRALVDPRVANRPISDIAFAAGFGDLSYFNRTFRRRYGTSPSDVRKTAKRGRD
jgi:AraC-like DNA-binding protein